MEELAVTASITEGFPFRTAAATVFPDTVGGWLEVGETMYLRYRTL